MASKKYSLPAEVKERIRQIWGWKTPDFSHAAKQAVCWAHENLYRHDLDAMVNVAISAGRLAEQVRNESPDAFIKAFEDKLLNDTGPSSGHNL